MKSEELVPVISGGRSPEFYPFPQPIEVSNIFGAPQTGPRTSMDFKRQTDGAKPFRCFKHSEKCSL